MCRSRHYVFKDQIEAAGVSLTFDVQFMFSLLHVFYVLNIFCKYGFIDSKKIHGSIQFEAETLVNQLRISKCINVNRAALKEKF